MCQFPSQSTRTAHIRFVRSDKPPRRASQYPTVDIKESPPQPSPHLHGHRKPVKPSRVWNNLTQTTGVSAINEYHTGSLSLSVNLLTSTHTFRHYIITIRAIFHCTCLVTLKNYGKQKQTISSPRMTTCFDWNNHSSKMENYGRCSVMMTLNWPIGRTSPMPVLPSTYGESTRSLHSTNQSSWKSCKMTRARENCSLFTGIKVHRIPISTMAFLAYSSNAPGELSNG